MNPQAPKNSHVALISAIVLGVLLIVALIFGYSAYSTGQDYKNNSDAKSAAAVAAAKKTQAATLQAQFDTQSKSPYKTYKGSSTYGSISFQYPKSWSAYVDETSSDEPLNAYFYPGQVPGTTSSTAFALRVELVNDAYADVLQQFQSQITAGAVSAAAYVPPKMKTVANVQVGTLFSGSINANQDGTYQQGQMMVIKVRDKTLKIYTESNDYAADFTGTILPSLTFVP